MQTLALHLHRYKTSVNNFINLESALPSQPAQGVNAQTAQQNNNSMLFSAILMQQMNGLGIGPTSEPDSTPDLSQGLPGNMALMKLLSTLMAQAKDAKP